jgi:hypothetical protein
LPKSPLEKGIQATEQSNMRHHDQNNHAYGENVTSGRRAAGLDRNYRAGALIASWSFTGVWKAYQKIPHSCNEPGWVVKVDDMAATDWQ